MRNLNLDGHIMITQFLGRMLWNYRIAEKVFFRIYMRQKKKTKKKLVDGWIATKTFEITNYPLLKTAPTCRTRSMFWSRKKLRG